MQPTQNPQANIKQNKTLTPQELESIALSEMYKRNDVSEIQKYYQEVLEKATPLFDSYAGKKRLKFEFISDPSVTTAYFGVNQKGGNPEIKVGLEFFIKNKLSAEQAVWVLMHELTHFTDYAGDRLTYMGQFENAKVLGVNMTDRLAEYFKTKSEEAGEGKELTPAQKKSLANKISKIYSSGYYNIINDIYVNQNVATTTEYTHDKNKNQNSKQGEVSKLYSEILFKERDFSAMPEFYQYLYFMLRGENVPEGMRVTEGAQAALAKDYEVNFKKYDNRRGFAVPIKKIMGTQEIINTFLNPNSIEQFEGDEKEVRINNQKDKSLKYRSEYVDSALLPTFSDLLFNDLKDKLDELEKQQQENKDKEKGGEGNEKEDGEQGEEDGGGNGDEEKGESEDGKGKNESEGGEGEKGEKGNDPADGLGDFLDDILDKMEEGSPDFIPDEVLDQYAEWKEGDDKKESEEKAKKEIEDKKAKEDKDKADAKEKEKAKEEAQEKAEQNKQKQLEDAIKNFAEKNNISEDTAERVAAARKDVAPYIDKLNELWKRIALQQGSEATSSVEGEYRTGSEVNVDAFIRQFDRVINSEFEKLRIMKRVEHEEKPSDRPERIEVSLILDQSGSMGDKRTVGSKVIYDGHKTIKNKIAERVATMLLVSLDNFNQWLAHVREQSKSKLHVDTEVIAFGDDSENITNFRYTDSGIDGVESDMNSGQKGVSNYKAVESVGIDMGYTYDHTALDAVLKNVKGEVKEKISAGKIMKIAFEITDGVSSDSTKTKDRIQKLKDAGVLVFAFQIGDVDEDDVEAFEDTWNTNADGVQRGYVVGENYAKLPEMIAKMLEEFLGEVKVYE